MNWSTYVTRMTRGQTQQQVADHIKVADQTTVGRWRRGTTAPKDPAIVAAFAQAYGGNVLEAFVAAGFLTREEAGMPPMHGVDFETLVDDDDALSDNAKIHLKNQYGLLKAASAVDRTHAIRDSILSDPDLDDATKARLLASFDANSGVTTIYSSSATVVEHPFAEGSIRRGTQVSRADDVDITHDDLEIAAKVERPKAARTAKSSGRAARAAQDAEAEVGQD